MLKRFCNNQGSNIVEMAMLVTLLSLVSTLVLQILFSFVGSTGRSEQYANREQTVEKAFGFTASLIPTADQRQVGIRQIPTSSNIIKGNGDPLSGTGTVGSYYLDRNSGKLWGPKTAGGWTGTRYNLIPNPSAETNTTGWTAEGGGSSVARAVGVGKFGNYTFQITAGTSGSQASGMYPALIPISPSTQYTGSAYVKAANENEVGKEIRLDFLEYASNNSLLATNFITHTLTSNWKRISITRTTVSNAATARLAFRRVTGATPIVYYADGIMLEPTGTLQSYFDATTNGGTPSGSGASKASNQTNLTSESIPIMPTSLAGDQFVFSTEKTSSDDEAGNCFRMAYIEDLNMLRIASASTCSAIAPTTMVGPSQAATKITDPVMYAMQTDQRTTPFVPTNNSNAPISGVSVRTIATNVYNRSNDSADPEQVFEYRSSPLINTSANILEVDSEASSTSDNLLYTDGVGVSGIQALTINLYADGGSSLVPGQGQTTSVGRTAFTQTYQLQDFCS